MCGHCLEYYLVFDVVEAEFHGHPVDPERLAPIEHLYLQDGKDLVWLMSGRHPADNEHVQSYPLELYVCRALAEMVQDHANWQVMADIYSHFGPDVAERIRPHLLLQTDSPVGLSPFAALFEKFPMPTTAKAWSNLIEQAAMVVDDCETLLQQYYDWWCDSESYQPENMAENGASDDIGRLLSIPDDIRERRKALELLLPQLMLAMAVVATHRASSPILVKLATHLPKYPPDFDAYDLWLVRIALLHCVKTNGVNFIIQHDKQLNVVTRAYCDFKAVLTPADRLLLSDYEQQQSKHLPAGGYLEQP